MPRKGKLQPHTVVQTDEGVTVECREPNHNQLLKLSCAPGDVTHYIQTTMKLTALGKVNLQDPEEVRRRIDEYLLIYAQAEMRPTVAGLGLALGLDRRRVWEIANDAPQGSSGKPHKVPQETKDAIKMAYHVLDTLMEAYMEGGKINPVAGIFLQKNHFGYRDSSDVVVRAATGEEEFSREDIAKRYLNPQNDVVIDSQTSNSDSD